MILANKSTDRKKRRKGVFVALCICACIALVGIIAAFALSHHVKASTQDRLVGEDDALLCFTDSDKSADVILILGCGVRDDGTPSHMLHDRLEVGYELYKSGAAPKILVSGDHGRKDYDEPNTMKSYLIEKGVPSEDIFMDHAGFSTYESMYRASYIFGVQRAIVVTQQYHLYRALYDAECFGIEAYGVPADLREYVGQFMREIREVVARAKDTLYCIYKPKPTYLGDKIDVSGDGNATNG